MVEERELFTNEMPEETPKEAVQNAEALTSNLTLLMPPRIDVDFMETEESVDAAGETIIIERLRRASISTYVPMRIFHEMLASRSDILKLKEGDANNPAHSAEMMDWMVDMTWKVWKRSEPKMSKERFENGLQMDQILELFQSFFGALMARMGERGRFMRTLQAN